MQLLFLSWMWNLVGETCVDLEIMTPYSVTITSNEGAMVIMTIYSNQVVTINVHFQRIGALNLLIRPSGEMKSSSAVKHGCIMHIRLTDIIRCSSFLNDFSTADISCFLYQ